MNPRTLRAPDVLVPARADTGEGPVFDHRSGALAWVDIPNGELHRSDLRTGRTVTTAFPTMLGAVAPRAGTDGWAAAVSEGFAVLDATSMTVVDPVLPEPDRRMNDAKCDARGRMWAGSTTLDFRPGGGSLHRWAAGAPSTVVRTGLILPNGIGWSPEHTTMYLADSVAHVVFSADFDLDDGRLGPLTPWCRIDNGLPDGLCVAADGTVWIAVWGGGEVQQRDAAGLLVARMPTPVSQPSSCALSADGTLYVTSARSGLTAEQLAAEPHAGSVFAGAVGVGPVPVAAFAG